MKLPMYISLPSTWRRDLVRGALLILPVLPAYSAISVAFGVLAVDLGMSPWLAVMMSAVVFAGTAQFAVLPMIIAGLPIVAVVATAAVVCARFFAMSAALAPYLRYLSRWERLSYGAHITSTNFAIHVSTLPQRDVPKIELFTTNIVGYVVWVGATAFGAFVGGWVGDLDAFGTDFAMPALFVGLLVPLIRSRSQATAAAVAGLTTIVAHMIGASHWTILLAAGAGCAAGWGLQTWTSRSVS
jgi:4-azaleucine resistance transporter AzlC